jgi:hypothetical protein
MKMTKTITIPVVARGSIRGPTTLCRSWRLRVGLLDSDRNGLSFSRASIGRGRSILGLGSLSRFLDLLAEFLKHLGGALDDAAARRVFAHGPYFFPNVGLIPRQVRAKL